MPSKSMPVREAAQIAEQIASEMNVELIDVELVKEPTGHFLRFYIDKPDGIYTIDTINELKVMYPGDELYLILGGDSIIGIDTWYKADELLKSCVILAAVREEDDLPALDRKRRELNTRFGADIRIMTFNRVDISSTDIRPRIKTGRSVRYLLPDECIEFMCIKGLYR